MPVEDKLLDKWKASENRSLLEMATKGKYKTSKDLPALTEINKEKRRVAISHRLTKENPFVTFAKNFPVGTVSESTVINYNEYALFVSIEDIKEIHCFLHVNDLSFDTNNNEEKLKKFKRGDKLRVKVLEIQTDQQKVRVGAKQTQPDPFDWFKNRSINDLITVKVISSNSKKGLVVKPEGCDMELLIKKSAIAINPSDARPTRWLGGEKVDVAISELSMKQRKVTLSIKLLEEIQRNEALKKWGVGEGSGKQLPFSQLSNTIKNKKAKKDE